MKNTYNEIKMKRISLQQTRRSISSSKASKSKRSLLSSTKSGKITMGNKFKDIKSRDSTRSEINEKDEFIPRSRFTLSKLLE